MLLQDIYGIDHIEQSGRVTKTFIALRDLSHFLELALSNDRLRVCFHEILSDAAVIFPFPARTYMASRNKGLLSEFTY